MFEHLPNVPTLMHPRTSLSALPSSGLTADLHFIFLSAPGWQKPWHKLPDKIVAIRRINRRSPRPPIFFRETTHHKFGRQFFLEEQRIINLAQEQESRVKK
jgi:hypothetical protein